MRYIKFFVQDKVDYYGSEASSDEAKAYAKAIASKLAEYAKDEYPEWEIDIVVGDGQPHVVNTTDSFENDDSDSIIADLHETEQDNYLDWITDVTVEPCVDLYESNAGDLVALYRDRYYTVGTPANTFAADAAALIAGDTDDFDRIDAIDTDRWSWIASFEAEALTVHADKCGIAGRIYLALETA